MKFIIFIHFDIFSIFGHGDHIHSVSQCLCLIVAMCPSRLAIDWQSVDRRVSGTWGFYFPSPALFHRLTDKVKVSSCLSLWAPDSLSFGRQTLDNPKVPGTHHHQLILHHHFLICSLRAYFSGCDQAPSLPCVSPYPTPPSIKRRGPSVRKKD